MSVVINAYSQLKGDRVVWLIVALLILFSLLVVYSTSGSVVYKMNAGSSTEYYLVRQLVFIAMGATLMYLAYRLHYMFYAKIAPILMIIAVPLLVYTFLFGVEINDAARWIKIPILDMSFQTSDFAKLALILYVARSLAMRQEYIKEFRNAFLPIIVPIVVVTGLIIPNDLSTGALLFATCFLMMFIGRISLKYVFLLILSGALVFGLIYYIGLQFPEHVRVETWVSRVDEFLNSDGEYQVQQSKTAIASGSWFGVGPGNSIQRNILPYAYADFIYSIICEEYGMLGGFAIVGLFLWLLFRSVRLVTRSPKTFGAILAIGLTLNIVVQAFANIAVSVQLVPATGLTLPLISMGGTSFLFTCISLGIILSVSRFVEKSYEENRKVENLSVEDESNH
ncbi:MAG: cell division protein FtsW [Saprospiraceae bacterium]|nr:cell division protein FtsW [Saprospiraceae bacterium]